MKKVPLLGKAIAKLFKGEFKEAGKLAKEGAETLWNANPVVDLTRQIVEEAMGVFNRSRS